MLQLIFIESDLNNIDFNKMNLYIDIIEYEFAAGQPTFPNVHSLQQRAEPAPLAGVPVG